MDLVASYDSEIDNGSDIEEIAVRPRAAKSEKKVDIIDLDSGSDNESKASKIGTKITQKSSINSKQVDCTNLEKNDCVVDTSSICSKPNEISKFSSDSSEKKIDYLNLESSDSDEVREDANNINTLTEFIPTLSDIPCGPQKPSDLLGNSKHFIENNSSEKDLDNSISMSSVSADVNYNSPRNTPDFVQINISCDSNDYSPVRKRLKGELPIETNFHSDGGDFGIEKDTLLLYREDERVIEASKKNVACRIPRQVIQRHTAHSNIVTSLNWCIPKFSYMFLSASLDGSIKIWDLFRKNHIGCIEIASGLNTAKWSLDGGQIIAGGYGEKAFVFDVQTGKKIVAYDLYNSVTSLEIHPYMEDVVLCGIRNAVLGFDIRVNSTFPIRSFFSKCEEVLDIAFLDENEFICSTNIVSHDSADRTIMAWDFSSGAILSNQIYMERFTCPSLKVHPTNSSFVAQTNGNYIASFSTTRPYKIKNKRYMGHKVSGYSIECDISPDGKYLVSGDAVGNVYFYNYANTSVVFSCPVQTPIKETTKENHSKEAPTKEIPTNRVKWHPAFSSTMITSTYNGEIQIWK